MKLLLAAMLRDAIAFVVFLVVLVVLMGVL
jgi:hypothetical protein